MSNQQADGAAAKTAIMSQQDQQVGKQQ